MWGQGASLGLVRHTGSLTVAGHGGWGWLTPWAAVERTEAQRGAWRQDDHPEGYQGSEGPGRGPGGEAFGLLSA